MEEKLLSANSLYSGKTFAIHNFIEKKPIPEKIKTESPYVAFASRLSLEKGVDMRELLRCSVAAGPAAITTSGTNLFYRDKYEEIYSKIFVEKL